MHRFIRTDVRKDRFCDSHAVMIHPPSPFTIDFCRHGLGQKEFYSLISNESPTQFLVHPSLPLLKTYKPYQPPLLHFPYGRISKKSLRFELTSLYEFL